MTSTEIARLRLFNQKIVMSGFTKPVQVVEWLVAMQAQEYAMAKWAIGLRLPGSNEDMVEKAFNRGAILRTHLMRPTWHFVGPKDIRWLLQLTAPRVHAVNAFMYRKLELDTTLFSRCNKLLERALRDHHYLTREELRSLFTKNKINAESFRLAYLLVNAELEGLICSGPRKGNQFSMALLEERVKPVKPVSREEALNNFTSRYFQSRGPATIKDFTTWSGLTVADAKAGIAALSKKLHKFKNGQQEYFTWTGTDVKPKSATVNFLMPDYDEYGMSYKDRSAILSKPGDAVFFRGDSTAFNRMLILDGKIEGTWRRTITNDTVDIEIAPFRPLVKRQTAAVKTSVAAYSTFIGKKERVTIKSMGNKGNNNIG